MDKINSTKEPLIKIEHLKMYFPFYGGTFHKKTAEVKAVDDISFSIMEGKTFGLVGESGCGKTTAGKCLLRVYEPTSGSISYKGHDITHLSKKMISPFRREIQLIFQDPYGSLDPRQSAYSILSEAIRADKRHHTKEEVDEKIGELLSMVELDVSMGSRLPHEMSGGQRQRLGIARALACEPSLIVCDEPVSALDVSIQAQIVNLFKHLQERLHLTYLFIAHDLAVVKHVADEVGVMYLGHIVEIMDAEELYSNPLHPYTVALLSAVPITDYYVERERKHIVLSGEVPSPINAPTGCPFHPRCQNAMECCKRERPELRKIGERHFVACHLFNG